jgi:parvulin-like peptidyl-prolyl isomerase
MKRIALILTLLCPLAHAQTSDIGDSPSVADITAQFAVVEALRAQSEILKQMVVLGFKYSIDRARKEIAEVLAEVLASREIAMQRQAEIDVLKAQVAGTPERSSCGGRFSSPRSSAMLDHE